MSTRDLILAANDISSEVLEVPVWGVSVEVRSMDARTRLAMMQAVTDADGQVEMLKLYPDMVIACAHDVETGERLFVQEDRDAILAKNAGAVELVAMAAMRVSGMSSNATDEAGKDSSLTPTEDSSLS